jgi:hypothetical protein
VGPLGLGDRAFDRHMIFFSVVVSALSPGAGFSIGATNYCKYCTMGWESFALLLWFLDFQWGWWVGFDCDLRVVILCWVGVLRNR